MRKILIALAIATFPTAVAAQPAPKGAGYAEAGSTQDGGSLLVASANTDVTVTIVNPATSNTVPACFGWGQLVTWKASGGTAVCVYTMAPGVTFNFDVGTNYETTITDTGVTPVVVGRGVPFTLDSSERLDAVPTFQNLYEAPGARQGQCLIPQPAAPGRKKVFPPCLAGSSDCNASTNSTGTTCVNNVDGLKRTGCAFVRCRVSAANTVIRWKIDR